ncbi:helix-turn-helix domain-containing protein [Streptomyces liliifuscus]|uniref:Helix-turn-helix transcriptional regulator n=1 Tax=Streptomyces liliifuscus TaxID=2797636 RepID=A0A7T7KY14_9ACTN|nr:helix-turn-helix transcriptional regulator [Streptomyces liliifuscus]QQM42827.1 helix-turn-helix transcriptional regulator [Streptomyces liliifuscus]
MSTPPEDIKGVMEVVRARVKELRGRKGWSGADLGKELSALGVPWNRSVVANFESGRRPAVSVQELLALALVLDVSPNSLLVPLYSEPYQVTPEGTEPQNSGDVWMWMRGQQPLPGTSAAGTRLYFAEVPTQVGRGERDPVTGLYEWYEKIDREGGDG